MGEACGLFNRSRRQYMPSDAGTIRRAEFIRPQSARRGRYQAAPALFGGAGSAGAARVLAMAMTLRNRTGIDFAAGRRMIGVEGWLAHVVLLGVAGVTRWCGTERS